MHEVQAKGILSAQHGMNIYRGCTHGCIYCDSRSKCYGMNHAFEDIEVKANAPQLLEKALRSMRSRCMIGTGSMSDPYMPEENKLKLMRRCLELIDRYGFGAAVQTKSTGILRDMDLLESINRKARAVVQMTLTTYDDKLCRIIEPGVQTTAERISVLETCREKGIPTIVWITPILPFINDTEENLMSILRECARTGVKGIICPGIGVTMREGNREYFYAALDRDFPGMKARYIRSFGNDYVLPSPNDERLMKLMTDFCRENGMMYRMRECFDWMKEFPVRQRQLSLFDGPEDGSAGFENG